MFQGCKNLCLSNVRWQVKKQSKCMSTLSKAEAIKRRCLLFEEEKKKQRSNVGRIQKIEVKYQTPLEEIVLIMNKDLSTPYDCCGHLTEGIRNISALALVDGQPWDMCKPLTDNCTLELLSLKNPKIRDVNLAFWRTCSFMMGSMIQTAFKEEVTVHLHSFPHPVIQSGSFVYDTYLDLPNWQPTTSELQAMSASFVKLASSELMIEPLNITENVALEMFQDNPYKYEQIPNIARDNDNMITVYKVGDHVDISKGPMIGNTRIIGRVTIASVHKLLSKENGHLYRFQGVALPAGFILNYYAYSILEERAGKLNDVMWIPQSVEDNSQTQEDIRLGAVN